jgi:hypothetical protein
MVAAILLASPALGQAQQTDYEAIVRIMRECAKITELEARTACYDNTINAERLIAGSGAARPHSPSDASAPSAPQQVQAAPPPQAQRAAPVRKAEAQPPAAPAAEMPQGFGAETVPPSEAARQAERAVGEVELGVSQAQRLEPGIYLLTLEDGSQWRFVDAVPLSYDPPRAGSRIELARAALGSFQMRFESQRPVRIMRVQ